MKEIKKIKTRIEESANYKAIWCNGKTLRFAIDPEKPIKELIHSEFYDIKVTGNCLGKCKFCVHPDTMVETIKGKKKIKNIEIGEQVFCFNETDIEVSIVENILTKNFSGDLINIELENNKILTLTPDHEVFTLNRGWIEAGELNETDELLEF